MAPKTKFNTISFDIDIDYEGIYYDPTKDCPLNP